MFSQFFSSPWFLSSYTINHLHTTNTLFPASFRSRDVNPWQGYLYIILMCIVEGFPWTLCWLPNKREIRGSLPILPGPLLCSQPQDGWTIIRQRSPAVLCRNGQAGGTHQSAHRYHQCSEIQGLCVGAQGITELSMAQSHLRAYICSYSFSHPLISNLFMEGKKIPKE